MAAKNGAARGDRRGRRAGGHPRRAPERASQRHCQRGVRRRRRGRLHARLGSPPGCRRRSQLRPRHRCGQSRRPRSLRCGQSRPGAAGDVPAGELVLFMDPPRAGASEAFLDAACVLAPSRIVYISCNPETQVRDVARLAQAGYRVRAVQPVDMFPHTAHVETVCLLTREKSVKSYAYVDITPSELGMGGKVKKPTYKQIQAYVLETHGLKVSRCTSRTSRTSSAWRSSSPTRKPGCRRRSVRTARRRSVRRLSTRSSTSACWTKTPERPSKYRTNRPAGNVPLAFVVCGLIFSKIFSKTYFRPPLADADSISLRKGIAPGQAIYRVARTVDSMTHPSYNIVTR